MMLIDCSYYTRHNTGFARGYKETFASSTDCKSVGKGASTSTIAPVVGC